MCGMAKSVQFQHLLLAFKIDSQFLLQTRALKVYSVGNNRRGTKMKLELLTIRGSWSDFMIESQQSDLCLTP